MDKGNQFLEELLKIHPHLRSYYESEQYKLSEKILDYAVNKGLSEDKMADKFKIPINKYLLMESGSMTIQVEDYLDLLDKMSKIINLMKKTKCEEH